MTADHVFDPEAIAQRVFEREQAALRQVAEDVPAPGTEGRPPLARAEGSHITGSGDSHGRPLPTAADTNGEDILDRIERQRARHQVQSPFGPPDQRQTTPTSTRRTVEQQVDAQRFVAPELYDQDLAHEAATMLAAPVLDEPETPAPRPSAPAAAATPPRPAQRRPGAGWGAGPARPALRPATHRRRSTTRLGPRPHHRPGHTAPLLLAALCPGRPGSTASRHRTTSTSSRRRNRQPRDRRSPRPPRHHRPGHQGLGRHPRPGRQRRARHRSDPTRRCLPRRPPERSQHVTTAPTKKPRTKKTAAQRAQEALAVADRQVKRLKADRAKHQGELNRVVSELETAERRRDYLAQNPDLPTTPATGTNREDPPA